MYFYQDNKTDQITDKRKTEKILITDEESNIIENIFYVYNDKLGNTFKINAKYGKIDIDNPDMVYMTDVFAIISSTNSSPITISSKYSEYNKKNYDTKFMENVTLSYLTHEVKSENLDLSFESNLVTIYNKVIYNGDNTELYTDIIEIDLITKNSKIFMNKEYKKSKNFYK